MERLLIILLTLRSTVKEDLGCCPAELVLGTPLRLPGEMICESQYRASDSKPTYIYKDLSTSPFVFVRADAVKKPLQSSYDGPYKVLQRNFKYLILDGNGTKDSVSIDRLKPAYLEPPPMPASEVRAHLPRPPTQTTEVTVPQPSPPPLSSLSEDASTPLVSTPVPLHHESYYTRSGRRVTFPSRLFTSIDLRAFSSTF
nr:hypothetical transcript [Hymenolepis microstoma]